MERHWLDFYNENVSVLDTVTVINSESDSDEENKNDHHEKMLRTATDVNANKPNKTSRSRSRSRSSSVWNDFTVTNIDQHKSVNLLANNLIKKFRLENPFSRTENGTSPPKKTKFKIHHQQQKYKAPCFEELPDLLKISNTESPITKLQVVTSDANEKCKESFKKSLIISLCDCMKYRTCNKITKCKSHNNIFKQSLRENLNSNTVCKEVKCFQMASKLQAGSYNQVSSNFPCKDFSNNQKCTSKRRILDERQAYSLPVKNKMPDIMEDLENILPQMSSNLSKPNFYCHKKTIFKNNVNVERDKLSLVKTVETFSFSQVIARDIPGNTSLHIRLLTNEMNNLERNLIFGQYSSTFLPLSSIQPSKQPFNFYHSQCIEIALEDGCIDLAFDFLEDFSTKYSPKKETVQLLINAWLKVEFTSQTPKSALTVILETYQKHPEIIIIDDPFKISPTLYLTSIELDLFTKLMCDNVKIQHSLAYSLLSWYKSRDNVLAILQELGALFTSDLTAIHLEKIYQLQRLLTISLEATLQDKIFVLKDISTKLIDLYKSLGSMSTKILFLSSTGTPALVGLVTRGVIESHFIVQHITDPSPSLADVEDSYFTAVPHMEQLYNASCDWREELSVLLYFTLYSVIESTKHRTSENNRSRLLTPKLEFPHLTRHKNLSDLLHHFLTYSPGLSVITQEYLLHIETLMELTI
ncbi:uncharacterized protein LOC131953831 [Physella acuta]|uniref:uncharacterized protein LOC131953831 n=1 Tax=Physella acuta TaxID=109671 RepID=UPI0027DBDC0A|nr:uncharacterized protein LOC131953831 [Physella acuta]